MKQLKHTEIKNNVQSFPITIVCDAIRTPENIGMCFRIAESFGVAKIYLHTNSPSLENKKIQSTARNTLNKVTHQRYSNFDDVIKELKREENIIIGLEITNKSIDLQQYNFKIHQKIAILIGSERNGIQNTNLLDASVAIPMFGSNSSMNVIHSLAIALYEITNQLTQI